MKHKSIRVSFRSYAYFNKEVICFERRIKKWNKEVFGDVKLKVDEALKRVEEIQLEIFEKYLTETLYIQECHAQASLQEVLPFQESFWKDKARVNWLIHGDRNTVFFHKIARIKNVFRQMSSLRNGEDIMFDPTDIEHHILGYFF